jgi:hypothetical protein
MTAIHRDHVATFHAFLNSVHENIKWTFESEVDGRINMLDLTILRQPDGSLEFDVFRKPMHTNQYIAWDSDQPLQHKGSTFPSPDALASSPLVTLAKQLNLREYTQR